MTKALIAITALILIAACVALWLILSSLSDWAKDFPGLTHVNTQSIHFAGANHAKTKL
ncbi:hypothetical protein [Phaeobacter gallaeciensis]|uniref:hypothetical protein n=1 Tax=Phaeobacter gallaeciensis TaxID=60890 RepID=UPI0015F1147C|nr:hypothetical protein [Phaeobacter gallaeciensis]